ncbi:MAG: helix-turn-helix transcriptional regulator [Coxiellaceae bacterium]|nr:helix-turn-helix transcriptional regulator [Coxiellaceae bacterium]
MYNGVSTIEHVHQLKSKVDCGVKSMSGINSILALSKSIHQDVWSQASVQSFKSHFSTTFKAYAGQIEQSTEQWIGFLSALKNSELKLVIDVKDAIVQGGNRLMVISSWKFIDPCGCERLVVESMMNYVIEGKMVTQLFYMWDYPLQQLTTLLESMPAKEALSAEQIKAALTPRELQCFLYVVQGRTAKQIANELQLSKRTIEEYLSHMKQKLGLTYLSDAISYAFNGGLFHVSPQLHAAVEV